MARQGFFEVVTGKIAKVSRENFILRTRTATCGVRGTAFSGYVSMFGDTIACTSGSIDVTSNDVSVPVHAGEVTYVKQNEPPRTPRKLRKGELKLMETKNIVIENSNISNISNIRDSKVVGNSGISIKAKDIKIKNSTIANQSNINKSNVVGNTGTKIEATNVKIQGSTLYNYTDTKSSNVKGNSGIDIGDGYTTPTKKKEEPKKSIMD
jgi:hypothetical protein